MYIERGTGNEIRLAVKNWDILIHYKPITEDLPEGDYFHVDMGTVVRLIVIKNMYFKTDTDAELFLDRMHTLNPTGMTLEIRKTSAAMPGSLFNFLSGKVEMEVACLDIAPLTKVAYGDGIVYKCGMCRFKQIKAFA